MAANVSCPLMKHNANGFQKFLRASKKLEETQVMRRMRDIEEIQQFDEQKEAQKTRQLQQQTTLDRHADRYKAHRFAHPEYADGEWLQGTAQELHDVLALEEFAAHAKMAASADELHTLGELHRMKEEDELRELQALEAFQHLHAEAHHEVECKQLPAAAEEVFSGKYADIIEADMQREFEDNRRALKEFEPPRLDVTPKKERAIATIAPVEADAPPILAAADASADTEPAPPADIVETDTPPPKRKSETVFYFRSTPNQPKK